MSKEILLVVDAVSNERGVDKDLIFEALEAALATAVRKKHGSDIDVRVVIDRNNGSYKTFRRWEVVEDSSGRSPDFLKRHIPISKALAVNANTSLGDYFEQPMESATFDRIAAQTAKQVIIQKVRDAERIKILNIYKGRKGELITGMVKRIERGSIILDLSDNIEAIVPKECTIPGDFVHVGDMLRGYLYDIRQEARGPQLFVSRVAPEFLIELFKLEVPEVGENLIQILGVARDPGVRAKVAVRSCEARIDAVGACVGMRGSRVQAVTNELKGERIDIILWDANPAQFVINAMAPADVVSIIVDEDSHCMDVAVREEKHKQAVGRSGQNVRLASQLTGWKLNVMDEADALVKSENESRALINFFRKHLHVDEYLASILVDEGFTTLDEVAYVPVAELLEIEELDENLIEQLRRNAKDAMLTRAIANEEIPTTVDEFGQPPQTSEEIAIITHEGTPKLEMWGHPTPPITAELLTLDGMDNALAYDLASRGLVTLENFAELSVDDLLEIKGMDERRAAAMIMKAREPWFANAQKK